MTAIKCTHSWKVKTRLEKDRKRARERAREEDKEREKETQVKTHHLYDKWNQPKLKQTQKTPDQYNKLIRQPNKNINRILKTNDANQPWFQQFMQQWQCQTHAFHELKWRNDGPAHSRLYFKRIYLLEVKLKKWSNTKHNWVGNHWGKRHQHVDHRVHYGC